MVCSICKETGHTAPSCNGQYITEWTERLRSMLITGQNNTAENDAAVKLWVQTATFNGPTLRRLLNNLNGVLYDKRFVGRKFFNPEPKTKREFEYLITNYVRPTDQEQMMNEQREVARFNSMKKKGIVDIPPPALTQQQQREKDFQRQLERQRQLRQLLSRQRQIRENDFNQQVEREVEQRQQQQQRVQKLQQIIRQQQDYNTTQNQLINVLKIRLDQVEAKIKFQMVDDDADFFKEKDCTCCMNPLSQNNTFAFGCDHVICAECAPKVIKMKCPNCPTCRTQISTIKFTRNIPSITYNSLYSSVM